MTFPGKWFIGLTVGVGAAAINTGNNLLYLALSMNLSLIILSGILSEWCLRGLRLRVGLASEAFASRESLLAITCSAEGKRFPAISVSVLPGLPGAGYPARFSEIPPGKFETRVVPYRPAHRGPIPPFACTISTRFPFSLFEKSAEVDAVDSSLIVYPEPGDAGRMPNGRLTGDQAGGPAARGRKGTSIRGVRGQIPQDPVRDIHWKASARLGRWMVKEREADSGEGIELTLPVPSPPEDFEQMVSRACADVLACEREGVPYRLCVGERVLVSPGAGGHRKRALSALARVRADGSFLPEGSGKNR